MKTAMFLFAGTMMMIMSATNAADNDRLAEERYRMKYGRYSPGEETRRQGAPKKTKAYAGQSCCQRLKQETPAEKSSPNSFNTEAWHKAKHGRATPGAEAREKAAEEIVARHIRKCEALGQCPLVAAEESPSSTNVAGTSVSRDEAWFRAKYGRATPGEGRKAGEADKNEQRLIASTSYVPCEMECCKPGL
jgi:hypothetical protein